MENKRLKIDFKALKLPLFSVLVLVGLFYFLNEAQAAIPFKDSFETYNIAPLNGQGSWTDSTNRFNVSTDRASDGSKSVRCSTSDPCGWAYKTGDLIATGNWTMDFYTDGSQSFPCYNTTGGFWRNGYAHFQWEVKKDGDTCKLWCGKTPSPVVAYFPLSYNEWHTISVKWNDTTNQAACKLDESDWSPWFEATDPGNFTGINKIGLYEAIKHKNFDNFNELKICELGNCKYCEIYDTCVEAGCFWYYSIYAQEYFCVEPYEPEEEECGSFFKCQFCMSQEVCESELNCEWTDRGYGDKCYMKEPGIPPPQAGWEVPELEDCEALEGVEKWLCEIKNFVAGIFMPSQEKIDVLYNTFGAMKMKFPFNYVGAMSVFFNDIKTGLGEEKGITFSILGQEAEVDFSFWENTTTIGGESETFFNLVKDFSSVIIVLGWFAWLISLIRRFKF